MTKFILAKEVTPCSKDTKKLCLSHYVHNENCVSAIHECPYAMRANPLCTNKLLMDCNRRWIVKKYEDKIYIFYYCDQCRFLIKGIEDNIESILEYMDDKSLIYGDKLKKLVKAVFKNSHKSTDMETTVKYFESKFRELNIR